MTRPLRVYVAGASAEPDRARWAMDAVRASGAEVAHDWLAAIEAAGSANGGLAHVVRQRAATECLEAVESSDVLWLLAPETPSAGAWVELGAALGAGIEVIASGPACGRSIFCSLAVDECPTDADALEIVRGLVADRRHR